MHNDSTSMRLHAAAILVAFLVGCTTTLPDEHAELSPSHALPPSDDGGFAPIVVDIATRYGSDASGFLLLDRNDEALLWRLALIDHAKHTLDLQYYLWYSDYSGSLLFDRILDAADRGVRVRILVDDIILTKKSYNTVPAVDRHPNIKIRVFNPFSYQTAQQSERKMRKLERINRRMHNKQMIADNQVVIAGGRNISDHYFGMGDDYNFHDLDVLAVGPIAADASEMFDHFWNSNWVFPGSGFGEGLSEDEAKAQRTETVNRLAAEWRWNGIPLERQDWSDWFVALPARVKPGTGEVVYDKLTTNGMSMEMPELLGGSLNNAEKKILIANAYVIPGDQFFAATRRLTDDGVDVRILTNSLASHDVPAVNSSYKRYRDDLIESGVELFELRADAAIKSMQETDPTEAGFLGFHRKAYVVDDETVFIGSMNFDPRSVDLNTEMGLLIESPGLAKALSKQIERDMSPENAWHVEMDQKGKLTWANSDETVSRQPARNAWQRIQDAIMIIIPKSQL